mgnify:CR=1 FL=1
MNADYVKEIGAGCYTILDLVGFRLPRLGWTWSYDAIDQPTARGGILRTWGKGCRRRFRSEAGGGLEV